MKNQKPYQVKMLKVFKDGSKVIDFFTNHNGMTYEEASNWGATHPAFQGFIKACAGASYKIETYEIVRFMKGA